MGYTAICKFEFKIHLRQHFSAHKYKACTEAVSIMTSLTLKEEKYIIDVPMFHQHQLLTSSNVISEEVEKSMSL